MMMSMIPNLKAVMVTRENGERSQRRRKAVERKTIKRKRVEKEIESITHLIVNQLMTKIIENEKMIDVEEMITPPMMDPMMTKRGGERGEEITTRGRQNGRRRDRG